MSWRCGGEEHQVCQVVGGGGGGGGLVEVAVEHTQLGCFTGGGSLQTSLDFELDAALAKYGAVLGVECIAAAELVELAAHCC